jgi:hypothetical protein
MFLMAEEVCIGMTRNKKEQTTNSDKANERDVKDAPGARQ